MSRSPHATALLDRILSASSSSDLLSLRAEVEREPAISGPEREELAHAILRRLHVTDAPASQWTVSADEIRSRLMQLGYTASEADDGARRIAALPDDLATIYEVWHLTARIQRSVGESVGDPPVEVTMDDLLRGNGLTVPAALLVLKAARDARARGENGDRIIVASLAIDPLRYQPQRSASAGDASRVASPPASRKPRSDR